MYSVRECSNFMLLHIVIQFPQHHLLKRLSFPHCIIYFCLLCHRLVKHRHVGLSLGFLSCSIDLYFCFCASTILPWWLWLCSIIWSQEGWSIHSSFVCVCVCVCVCVYFIYFFKHTNFFLFFFLQYCIGFAIGGRGVQDGEHVYIRGGFMLMYGIHSSFSRLLWLFGGFVLPCELWKILF